MQELLYTSVPRGLKPGSRGFSTVLSTQGMVAPLAAALEALSGYRPVFPIGHARVAENPVVYSHLKLQVAGKSWYVLSRVADYGLDYSQRTNKLAHHLVLDKSELPAAGPASLLRASGIMRESWEGEPKIVPPKPMSKHPIAPSGMCQSWKEMTGDAGWAGVLAESFLKDPNRPVILLFEPGQDLRPLIDESLSLLPAERRWDVTFSTYFTGSSQGITCLWRGIVLGSKEATESLRFVNALRIDLTSTDIGRAEGGELVDAARKGIRLTARPTLSPKQTPSREQPEPRVVVKDDAGEPAVARTSYEEADTETRAAPLASHEHSQAPPRLTRSAFKFANAGRHTDEDDPGVRTSRGRRFIIPLLIVLLLGGSAAAIIALNRPRPKPPGLALAESTDLPETNAVEGKASPPDTPATKITVGTSADGGAGTSATTEGQTDKSKGGLDTPVTSTPASEGSSQPKGDGGSNSSQKEKPEVKVSKSQTATSVPEVKPAIQPPEAVESEHVFELFEHARNKLTLVKEAAYDTGIPAELRGKVSLSLLHPFATSRIESRLVEGELRLSTPQPTDQHFATFRFVDEAGRLRLVFKKEADADASRFLRFCVLRLKSPEHLLDVAFFKSVPKTALRFVDGKTKFDSVELKDALDQKLDVRCDIEIKTEKDGKYPLHLERKEGEQAFSVAFDKKVCQSLTQKHGTVAIAKLKNGSEFQISLHSEPSEFSDLKNKLSADVEKLVNAGPGFVSEWQGKNAFGWGQLYKSYGGLFEKVSDAEKNWRKKNKDIKQKDNDEATKFMSDLETLKNRMQAIVNDLEKAKAIADGLGAADLTASFSIRIGRGAESAKADLLQLTGTATK